MSNYQQRGNRVAAAQNAGGHDAVQGQLRPKTHLIQLYCDDPEEAPRLVSQTHPQGIPLMVIVNDPSCCYCKVNIPQGMMILEQKCGVDMGIMEPGFRCCYCNYKRIAVMITKNTIRFRCPIESVPTKDDVRVSIDVGINFHIGRGDDTQHEDAKRFFYNFGPNRLEELLQEECEEEIRDFLKKIKVSRVRDIKTELTSSMLAELQAKFNPYGIVIEQVNIMNVILPIDLRFALMQTTTFDVFLQKQVKQQENRMLIINNQENKQLLRLKRDNIQTLMTYQHNQDVEEINLLQSEIQMETAQNVAEINGLKKQSTKTIEATTEKDLAVLRSNAFKTKVLMEAEAYKIKCMIEADQKAAIIKENAQARLEVAKNKSEALIKEAVAEEKAQGSMEGIRRHTEKMKLAESLENLAKKGHMVVSGENGQKVLDFYNQTLDLVGSR